MQAFFFRLFALLIRFICPLAALALSSVETMGKYYLFVSYFMLVSGIATLELAVPFSRKYLLSKNNIQRRIIFGDFIINQSLVSLTLAIPACIFVSIWADIPLQLIPLFCLSVATEGCAIEGNRFFWNIGESKFLSKRDLIRAVIFTVAVVISIYFMKEVVSIWTFLIVMAGNLCIIVWEFRLLGGIRRRDRSNIFQILRRSLLGVRWSLSVSIPQFLHMQILTLQTLLERVLVEKTLGLASVGVFSFLTSLIQSATGLLLVPAVAKVRQSLLSAENISNRIIANSQVKVLLFKVLVISAISALIAYISLPLVNMLLRKDLFAFPSLALIAYLSSASAIFYSSIAPLFSRREYAWFANGLSLLVTIILGIAILSYQLIRIDMFGLFVIGVVALLQLLGRAIFVHCNTKALAWRVC